MDSEPEPEQAPGKRAGAAQWVRLIAAGLVAGSLSLLILSSHSNANAELRVHVPSLVQGRSAVPIRAFLYEGLLAVQGPHLGRGQLRAELLDKHGRVLARIDLAVGLGPSHEGQLPVPQAHGGPLRVRVSALREGAEEIGVVLPLRRAEPEARKPTPRALRALQQLALGVISPGEPAQAGPSLVVAGGACVPEQPCELLAFAGAPFSRVQVRGRPSAQVVSEQAVAGRSPLTRAVIHVHGPEASVVLEAFPFTDGNAGRQQRAVRLPVALGSVALAPAGSTRDAPLTLVGSAPGPCIVDVFVDGHWVHTGTVDDCSVPFESPAMGETGLRRLQVRTEPFESQSVAVRVLPAGGAAGLADAARAVLACDPGDPALRRLAKRCLSGEQPASAEASGLIRAALLAALEQGLQPLPHALSSQPAAQAAERQRGRKLRALSVALVLLAGTLLLAFIGAAGLSASRQAEVLMRDAGQDRMSLTRARHIRQGRLGLSLLAVALGFLAVAAYVVVRFG